MSTRYFDFAKWAELSATGVKQLLAGKFTRQAGADLVAYKSDGTLWVGQNTGTSFDFKQWATVSPPDGWQFYSGDFTGTGRIDIVGYHPSNGTFWLGVNEGSKFDFVARGTITPGDGWQFAVGYFTGQSKAELVGYHASRNQFWIGTDNGTVFTFQTWDSVPAGSDWTLFAGDFAGNGRTDVLMYHSATGELHVGTNSGTGFTFTKWSTLDPANGWQIGTGYFTDRGKCDIFAHHPTAASMYIGENTGNGFNFVFWGNMSQKSGWDFVTATFDADLWTDIVAYYAADHTVLRGRNVLKPVEGYCWPLSAEPGQTISFYISGGQTITGQYMRHASTGPSVTSTLMQTITFEATEQTTAEKPWASGCGWTETISLTVPTDWPSGIYSLRCNDIYGRRFDITFMVKPAAAQRTNIAVLANVNTWLTYNGWGGHSKYSGLARTSFMRPCVVGQPEASAHLTRGELWITGWLESIGARPDVFTDIDFHNDGLDAAQYKVLVLSTHPEYWSTQMYDKLKD